MNPVRYLEVAADITRIRADRYTGTYRLGAVGMNTNGTLVTSYNVTNANNRCPSGHAEHRIATKLTNHATVFVARTLQGGEWALSKPCGRCRARLRNAGVKKVYYTIAPGEYGVMKP